MTVTAAVEAVTECHSDACKICTGCYHGNHGACRVEIRCDCWNPDTDDHRTGVVNVCRCCGTNTNP